ncbi:hypothetical protein GF325_12210, partial [Candidatus Bathyarchaeota archaeon]|nr:hypothetical protein [Candidatus Bathyarchaeota archaeon]
MNEKTEKRYNYFKLFLALGLTSLAVILPITTMFKGIFVMYNDGELLDDGRIMLCQYEIWRFRDQ